MIDIHTHVLPGVDDGPGEINESLWILKCAKDDGIKTIVTTPHVFNISDTAQREKIDITFQQLKEAVSNENINITLIWGAEIMVDYRLINEMEQLNYYSINKAGRYVLLDLPMYELPPYILSVIYEIKQNGIIPIIAHPERNAAIIMNHEKLEKLLLRGAVAQLNAGSLLGEYGNKVRKTAGILLKKGYISLIGSDVHSYENRYSILKAAAIMNKIITNDEIEKILYSNVDWVVEGKYTLNKGAAVN